MKAKLLLLSAFIFGISIANAQTKTPLINHTQKHQQERIKQGTRHGELTKAETRNLNKDQRSIAHQKRVAKRDGVVTKNERKNIRQDQRKESREIFRKKHNAKTA